MRSSSTSLWLPVALLLVAMISFNAGAAFAKQLLPSLGAMGTATLRLSFASIMLCLIFRPWSPRPSSKSLRMIAVHGLTIGMMNVLFYLALLRVPLGVAVALEFMGPLAVAVSSSRKKLDYLWVGLAVIGVLILLPRTDTNGALPLQGIIYALGAACCWAMYIIIGKKAGATAASGTAASIGMLAGALAIMPFGLATSGLALLDTQFWPSALTVALLSSALPYYLDMIVLKAMPAKTFGVLMSMEPAMASLSGVVILHEYLSGIQWLAVTLVMSASFGAVAFASMPEATPELTA